MSIGYLDSYLVKINNPELTRSIHVTSEAVCKNVDTFFDYKSHINGLLFGNVQSGKTGQMLGVVSQLADREFKLFVLLTTDNVYLQTQTFERVKKALDNFNVIGEYNDVEFFSGKLQKPTIVVLKKNTNVLKKWRNNLSASNYCKAKPIILIDDEADSASLNTLVNKKQRSTINKHLESIKNLASSSIYLQVTATPQAIFLQSVFSGWKPLFINFFHPGTNYLGGDFFYSNPPAFCVRFSDEDELDNVREGDSYIPKGLRDSLMSFLVICANAVSQSQDTCNFLIHPSVRIDDHEKFARCMGEHLNLLFISYNDDAFKNALKDAWRNLQTTKPDITNFDDIKEIIKELLEQQKIKLIILNSKSSIELGYQKGFNIVIGGNSLGRGITLPKLQVVYYCRKSKAPQADTFWQHSRMFGYDRDAGLMRIYLPPSLHKLFMDLNNSNRILIDQIKHQGINGIQILLPEGIKPTRSNVLDTETISIVTGGMNFFPISPDERNAPTIDSILADYNDDKEFYEADIDDVLNILSGLNTTDPSDWDNEKFMNCARTLKSQRPHTKCNIIVRRNRNISKGTGTLLAPTDRNLGITLKDSIILTLYRVNGDLKNGWSGNPFWIPNIKFPENICFYDSRG